jgi:hypothetical protein
VQAQGVGRPPKEGKFQPRSEWQKAGATAQAEGIANAKAQKQKSGGNAASNPTHESDKKVTYHPALRRLRQEDSRFKSSLGYIVRPCLKKEKKSNLSA